MPMLLTIEDDKEEGGEPKTDAPDNKTTTERPSGLACVYAHTMPSLPYIESPRLQAAPHRLHVHGLSALPPRTTRSGQQRGEAGACQPCVALFVLNPIGPSPARPPLPLCSSSLHSTRVLSRLLRRVVYTFPQSHTIGTHTVERAPNGCRPDSSRAQLPSEGTRGRHAPKMLAAQAFSSHGSG